MRPMGLDALLKNQLALPLGKFPEVAHTLSFHPKGRSKIEIILTLWDAVSEIWTDVSKLLYLSMKLGHWRKFQKLHIQFLSTPRGRN